ncbi:TetR family transcriptional regulator [bacterium]|nr:TetR family transcriptional regulator [bacterium]
MARKTTFTREDVLTAAMTVLETEGVAAVTARRVADTMGASTAPVYSNFANMEDVLREVLARVAEQVLEYCRRPWTDDPFLNMGVGFVRFAVDRPELFRAMYLDSTLGHAAEYGAYQHLLDDLARHERFGALPDDHRQELLFQASVYTLGIATTVVTGMWPEPDLELVESWLRSVGSLLVAAAFESAGVELPEDFKHQAGEFVVPWRHPGCPAAEDRDDE